MVAVASRGLGSGRGSALLVALGMAVGGFGWAMMTTLGFGALFDKFPILVRILGVIGGLYLSWLGYKGWRAAITGAAGEIAPQTGQGAWRDVRYGLAVTATNPKVALFWASLSTFVGGQTTSMQTTSMKESWSLLILFACGSSVILFAIYGGYGLLFSGGGIRQIYARFQKASEAVFGTIFGMIGIAMILRSVRGGS
jgi:threonine/homoserine/homoserine lactone efflux protein